LVFQLVGAVLFLGTCCWWSFAGRLQDEIQAIDGHELRTVDVLRDASASSLWTMAGVCVTFVGGLALASIGIGLQHGREGCGRASKWLTGLIAAFFWSFSVAAIVPDARSWGQIAIAAFMAIAWTGAFLLAGAAAEEIKQEPITKPDSSWTAADEDDLRKSLSLRPRDKTNP
jgi:hypothetical protein